MMNGMRAVIMTRIKFPRRTRRPTQVMDREDYGQKNMVEHFETLNITPMEHEEGILQNTQARSRDRSIQIARMPKSAVSLLWIHT